MRRLLASLILVVALAGAFPAAAVAAQPAASVSFALQSEPAVEAEMVEESEEEQPWTARFLAPLFVVLAIVAIVASGAIYMGRVKRRFTVAE